jgi:hypothetical protein
LDVFAADAYSTRVLAYDESWVGLTETRRWQHPCLAYADSVSEIVMVVN